MAATNTHNLSGLRRQRQFTSMPPAAYRALRNPLEVSMAPGVEWLLRSGHDRPCDHSTTGKCNKFSSPHPNHLIGVDGRTIPGVACYGETPCCVARSLPASGQRETSAHACAVPLPWSLAPSGADALGSGGGLPLGHC